MRPRRILLGLLAGIVAVVLIAAGLVWWLVSTEAGSRRVVAFLLGKSPEGLEIAEVRGSFMGELRLSGVRYRSGGLSAELDAATLDLRPRDLLHGRVMLERVHVFGMRVVLPDSTPEDTAGTARVRQESPVPPLPIEIGEGTVEGFELDAPSDMSVRDGKIAFVGSMQRYRFDLTGVAFVPSIDTARIHLGGTGTLEGVRLDSTSTTEMVGGRVIPVGTVRWYPNIGWDLALAIDSIEPARLLPQPAAWPGRVSLVARSTGGIDTAGLNGVASLDSIEGTIRGRPVSGNATVRFRSLRLEHVTTDMRWGPAAVRSEGSIGDAIAMKYDVTVSDLGGFMRGARGSVRLAGDATGPTSGPRIRANVRGSGLQVAGLEARSLTGRVDVVPTSRGRIAINLLADSASVASRPYERVTIVADGSLRDHRLTLRAASAGDSAVVSLAGGVGSKTWRGQVDTILVPTPADRWRLLHPASLVASSALVRLDTLCVVSDSLAGRACADAEWRNGRNWHVLATADSLQLDRLPLASPMKGTVVARIDARNTDAGLHGTVTATLADSGRPAGELNGEVTLPGYRLGRSLRDQSMDATVKGWLDHANMLAPYVGADSAIGKLTVDLHGTGVATAPGLEGEIRADSAALYMPGRMIVSGSAVIRPDLQAGPGRSVEGEVRLETASLELVQRRFHGVDTLRADSAGAVLVVNGEGMHVSGGMRVRNADGDSLAGVFAEISLPGYHELRKPPATQEVTFSLEATLADLGVLRPFLGGVDSLSGTGSLTLGGEGRMRLPTMNGSLRVENATGWLATGGVVRGGLTGDLDLQVFEDRRLRATLKVVPENVRLAGVGTDTTTEVRVRDAALDAHADDEGVRATLDGKLVTVTDSVVATVQARAALPDYRRVGAPIARERMEATITGRVDDFGFLPAFVTAIDSAAGTMTFDATLAGTVSESRMSGGAEVKDAALRFPAAGILVEHVNLTAKGDQEGVIMVRATATSGGGELIIEGHTPTRPTTENPGFITVRGTGFVAAYSDEIQAAISPDLLVRLAGDTLAITGLLEVPRARIELSEAPEVAVRPSDDVIVVKQDEPVKRDRPVTANVRVVLGDDVSFEGFNFNADLAGALYIEEEPGRPSRASGTLVIEQGYYRSYGQDLTVNNGTVRFAGPIDNPTLNIRAERVVNDTITVGIAMMGSLKEPDVRLYASSPMAQTQILSYIVTGGPVGGSGASGNLINKALSALGIGGSSQIVTALGEDIGLSSARIETEGDLQDASLVVGKYLSSRVYVSYGVGLFDPVSTIRLRYILSNKLTLLAEQGKETSADAVIRVKGKP